MSGYGWTYLDSYGVEVGHSARFEDSEAAEAWMGDSWRDLLENGVEAVALVDHARQRTLYRMGLSD
jgi:hypothetical protein